jgi:hypothetical protein
MRNTESHCCTNMINEMESGEIDDPGSRNTCAAADGRIGRPHLIL